MLNHYLLSQRTQSQQTTNSSVPFTVIFQQKILRNISKWGISEAQMKWEIKNRRMHLQWSLTISFQICLKIRLQKQSSFQTEKRDFTVKWKNAGLLSEIPHFSLCATGSEQEMGKAFLASIYDCWHAGLHPRTIGEILEALRKSHAKVRGPSWEISRELRPSLTTLSFFQARWGGSPTIWFLSKCTVITAGRKRSLPWPPIRPGPCSQAKISLLGKRRLSWRDQMHKSYH